jgi:lipid-A-disaccharide synthase
MKYYIIAGEASGDLHASNLMRELKKLDVEADYRCWGGDLMQEQGAKIVKHLRDISFMGFVEVAVNIRTILGNISFCKRDILNYKPDVIILVDYPGFNLRIAEFAKENGIKVFYYISPQVWAWKKGRVKKIRRVVDRMYVILPFEKDFYSKYNYEVDFVGHPLLDAISQFKEKNTSDNFVREFNLGDRPIIALLPGSRKQEIENMLKTMISVAPQFPEYSFVVAAVQSIPKEFYEKVLVGTGVKYITGKTYELLVNADAALVTSGTATLETALFSVPEMVCYRGSRISYEIAKRVIKIKYISLVNLILDKPVVKEFIQQELNTSNLVSELHLIMDNKEYRSEMLKSFDELKKILGGAGASEKAAKLMHQRLIT